MTEDGNSASFFAVVAFITVPADATAGFFFAAFAVFFLAGIARAALPGAFLAVAPSLPADFVTTGLVTIAIPALCRRRNSLKAARSWYGYFVRGSLYFPAFPVMTQRLDGS